MLGQRGCGLRALAGVRSRRAVETKVQKRHWDMGFGSERGRGPVCGFFHHGWVGPVWDPSRSPLVMTFGGRSNVSAWHWAGRLQVLSLFIRLVARARHAPVVQGLISDDPGWGMQHGQGHSLDVGWIAPCTTATCDRRPATSAQPSARTVDELDLQPDCPAAISPPLSVAVLARCSSRAAPPLIRPPPEPAPRIAVLPFLLVTSLPKASRLHIHYSSWCWLRVPRRIAQPTDMQRRHGPAPKHGEDAAHVVLPSLPP